MKMDLNKGFFDALLSTVPLELQILEPVRQKGRITDFIYRGGSQEAYGNYHSLEGKNLLSVYPWKKAAGLFDQFIAVAEAGKELDTVVALDDPEKKKWFHIRAKKYNDDIIVSRNDITMARQTEEKIMELNSELFRKNRELEALSSELKTFNNIAAQDYNETLRHLYKNLEFVVKNDARNLSDTGKANIRRAQAAIQKMKLMTSDIIAFSQVHSEQEIAVVDLNNILSQVLHGLHEKLAAEKASVKIDRLPTIQGYPSLLSLLFHHLVNNSLKFRKESVDPVIDIRYKQVKGDEIEHSAAIREFSYHQVSVIDNGIGFDPAEGEKIFTMFYRLQEKGKHKGSGIGLAICKKVMDLHGGFIASECTPECTTFKCYFSLGNKE